MPTWKKPTTPPATLTRTDSSDLPENKTELTEMGQRTRPPLPNFGTYGDTVYPGSHHTSDPKAPKVTKSL
jgi:hypothetical protein